MFLAAAGMAGGAFARDPWVFCGFMTLAAIGTYAPMSVWWSYPTMFLSGMAAAGAVGLINSMGNLGGFVGPYLTGWVRQTTGSFALAMLYLSASLAAAGVLILTLRKTTTRSRAKLDQEGPLPAAAADLVEVEFAAGRASCLGGRVGSPRKGCRRDQIGCWFYLAVALFMILLSFAGFSPSIADQSRRSALPTPQVVVHGALALAWLLLFLAQATLVATRRVPVHRRLGLVGPLVAVAMIVVGYVVTVNMVRRGYDLSGDLNRVLLAPGAPPPPAATISFPLAELLTFGSLVAAGLSYRHRPDIQSASCCWR